MPTPDHIEGNERTAYLDTLYLMDGRDYPKHPLHGCYTDLYRERQDRLMAHDRKVLTPPGRR